MTAYTYWHKQTADSPLFPDLQWSRPETRQTAGKLLIIGGNIHGFSAVGQAFAAAQTAGIGTTRIVLPDVLQKTVRRLMPDADYAPSTPSGSFAQSALAECLAQADWADGTLLAGDLGRNSETAILLEKFAAKYTRQLTITKDAADYYVSTPETVKGRSGTCLVITMAQLQKLAANLKYAAAFTFDMNLNSLIEQLHEFSAAYPFSIILKHLETIFVAVNGQISTTQVQYDNEESWRIPVAAKAAVWWLQNPNKTFEALSSSILH